MRKIVLLAVIILSFPWQESNAQQYQVEQYRVEVILKDIIATNTCDPYYMDSYYFPHEYFATVTYGGESSDFYFDHYYYSINTSTVYNSSVFNHTFQSRPSGPLSFYFSGETSTPYCRRNPPSGFIDMPMSDLIATRSGCTTVNYNTAHFTDSFIMGYQVRWTALDMDIDGPTTPTSVCESRKINLRTTHNYGDGNYIWKYRVEGQQTFTAFNSPRTNHTTDSISLTNIFGSDYSDHLGKRVLFQASVGNCISSTNAAYIFQPEMPSVISASVSGPACVGDDWQIDIDSTSRSPRSGERFTYLLYSSNSTDSFISGPDTTDTNTLKSTGTPGGLKAGRTYYVLVEASLEETLTSTGCDETQFYPVTVGEPDTALTISTNKTDETCHSANDGTIIINASGGWTNVPYKYSIDSTTITETSNTFTGLAAGTYTMRVEDSGGCVKSATVTIVEPATELTIGTPSKTDETCRSAGDGTITINASGGWTDVPYKYSIDSTTITETSNTFTGLAAGTYTMRVEDSGGCVKSTSVTIDEPATELTIGTPSKTDETCHSADDGTIIINASGGWTDVPYKYSINNTTITETSNTFTGLAAGTYTMRVEDSGGCVKSASVTIDEPATELTIGTPTKTETCKGTSEGTISLLPSGGWESYTYSINSTSSYQSSNIFTSLGAGIYTMRVKDSGGCVQSTDVTIVEPATVVSFSSTSKTEVTCKNTSTGTITVVGASGGWGDYEYSKDNGTTYQASDVINNLPVGTYTVLVRDSEGCTSSSQSVTITEPDISLSFTYSRSQITCQGDNNGTITITETAGWGSATYSIDNGVSYQASNAFTGLSPGLYQLRVKDSGNCETAKQDVVISEPNNFLDLTINQTDIICKGASGGTIALTGAGGWGDYTYSIDDGATFQSSDSFINLSLGDYQVKVKDVKGCETTAQTVTIAEPNQILSFTSQTSDVSCKNARNGIVNITAAGGWSDYEYSKDGGTSYQWSNSFTQLTSGSYDLVLKDSKGCETTAQTVTITEPDQLQTTTHEVNATCGGNNGSADSNTEGGTLPYDFTWRDATNQIVGSSSTLSNVTSGIYTLTTTDIQGCSVVTDAVISSTDGPKISISQTTATSCFNSSDGTATIEITEGSAGYSILWDNGQQSSTATGLPKGEIIVKVTDSGDCLIIERVTISGPEPITINNLTLTPPTCIGESTGRISVSATGGNGDYTYQWNTGDTGTDVANLLAGTYQVTITDTKDCELIESITLSNPEPISYSIVSSTSPTCAGGEDGSIEVTALGGTGVYTITWPNGVVGNSLTGIASGTYELTIEDGNQCILTDQVNLESTPPLEFDIEDKTICSGQQYVQQAGIEAVTYEWSGDNDFSATTEEVLIDQLGTYHLHIINADGCEAEDSFILSSSDDLLNADFLMTTGSYVGDTVVIIDISWPVPDNIEWDFEGSATILTSTDDYVEVTFTEEGVYEITLDVALAECADFTSQQITILGASDKPDEGGRTSGREESLITSVIVYPNPTDGQFSVEVELSRVADINIKLVNVSNNRQIINENKIGKDRYTIGYNLSTRLQSGIYFVVVEGEGELETIRLMIR